MIPFKFTEDPAEPGEGPIDLTGGVAFTGYDSFAWTERYQLPGEFRIIAPLSSNLMTILPKGTLISHVETYEVAVVEDIQLTEEKTGPPMLEFTGTSLDKVALDNRIVGSGLTNTVPPTDYILSADTIADQVAKLISDHVGPTAAANDKIDNLMVSVFSSVNEGPIEARTMKREPVHAAVMELLAINDYGIRVIRTNQFNQGLNNGNTLFHIHRGVDRSAEVIFTYAAGDLEAAAYLWSMKTLKNAALVRGRYVERLVYSGTTFDFDRRTMLVDASDIDDKYDITQVTGATLTSIQSQMDVRGRQALENQQEVSITRSDVSPNSRYRYRKDYNIGDIVSVEGSFGVIEKRRIVEYLEVDEKGSRSGHPTMAELPPNAIL